MTYTSLLPDTWDTERIQFRCSVVEEVPTLQAIHDACSYLKHWDGEYTDDPHHLHTLVTDPPLPPQGGERERFKILTMREKASSEIVGFLATYEGEPSPESLYIMTFFIHPTHQKQGFGRETFARFFPMVEEAGFAKVTLCTALKNFPAVRFWTGLGVNRIVKVHGDKLCSETTHAQVDLEMIF